LQCKFHFIFRAAAGFHRLSAVAGHCPSGLAVAPKVASAPRGPVPATLAGNPVQSLPQCPISLANKTQKNGGMKTTNRFLMVPLPFLSPNTAPNQYSFTPL
jgi:hypothetical protein